MACTVRGVAWARAFSTTPVVAGLKAEPVNRLDGGPRGTSALSRATPSDSHRVRMNGSRPAKVSFLYGAGVIRDIVPLLALRRARIRSEEHTSELQSLMRNSYAVFCLKKTKKIT